MLSLTREGCAARRADLIKAANVDLIVITNPRHLQYFTGLYVTPLALSAWGPNALLIDTASGVSTLVVHNSLEEAAGAAHADRVEAWRWYNAATDPGIEAYRAGVDQLNARLRGKSAKRIGVEIGWLPFGAEVGNSPTDVSGLIWTMRRRKGPDELALTREAVRVVGAGHRAARQTIKPGITELDVYNSVHSAIVKEAGGPVLVMGDFASGERAEAIGGPATDRVLRDGDLMICDIFSVVNGYRADYTATIAVGGKPSERHRQLETALHEAIAAGEAMLKPGSVCGDVYRAVHGALAKRGFGDNFPHHAGHGLGLGHPDAPYFVPNSQETLIAGDVMTLEPGAYGPGFGARIEHNYLITDTGFERLSQHSTAFV